MLLYVYIYIYWYFIKFATFEMTFHSHIDLIKFHLIDKKNFVMIKMKGG